MTPAEQDTLQMRVRSIQEHLDAIDQILNAIRSTPKRHRGRPCSTCGTTDRDCVARIRDQGRACCGRCQYTATHGQDTPDYVPPWEEL